LRIGREMPRCDLGSAAYCRSDFDQSPSANGALQPVAKDAPYG